MDAAFADDDDPTDDRTPAGEPVENIGHFCPIDGADLSVSSQGLPPVDDFGPDPARWHYHWTIRLFDYLTAEWPLADAALSSNSQESDIGPTDGLVNINTAPWRVLAAVPWLPPPPNASDPAQRAR